MHLTQLIKYPDIFRLLQDVVGILFYVYSPNECVLYSTSMTHRVEVILFCFYILNPEELIRLLRTLSNNILRIRGCCSTTDLESSIHANIGIQIQMVNPVSPCLASC